jgi:hypothetical protein
MAGFEQDIRIAAIGVGKQSVGDRLPSVASNVCTVSRWEWLSEKSGIAFVVRGGKFLVTPCTIAIIALVAELPAVGYPSSHDRKILNRIRQEFRFARTVSQTPIVPYQK